jgi:hypothetical protein
VYSVSNNNGGLVYYHLQIQKICSQRFVMADDLNLTAEQTEKILQFQVIQIKFRHK